MRPLAVYNQCYRPEPVSGNYIALVVSVLLVLNGYITVGPLSQNCW